MKSMKPKSKSIVLTVLLSMIILGVFAQTGQNVTGTSKMLNKEVKDPSPPVPPPPPPPPEPPDLEQEAAPPLAPVITDLTDDQKLQLKKLDLKNLEVMVPLRNQIREKKAHLATLLSTQPVNMKEAELVADEIGKIQATLLKQLIHHDQLIRAVLTPDQKIIFDSKPKPFLKERMRPGR
jgi:hypothetical protein